MSDAELVSRIVNLERDNRRLKAFAFGALVLAAALGGIYATRSIPLKITAHEFDVVDSSGRARVNMRVQSDGIAIIEVDDAQGVPRVAMMTNASGAPSVNVFNEQGHEIASLGSSNLGGGDVAVEDSQGQTRAIIGATDSLGGSDFWLYDASGNRRAAMTVSASGAPAIQLSDARGFNMYMGSTSMESPTTGVKQQTSAASIVMSGKDHHVIWQAP